MEIMSPASKNLHTYLVNRMMAYVYREFKLRDRIAADELSFLFSNVSDATVRKNMKVCADLEVFAKFSLSHKRHLELHAYSFSLFCITNSSCKLLYHIIILTWTKKMQRDENGKPCWSKKRNFDKILLGLNTLVAPEDVSLDFEFISCLTYTPSVLYCLDAVSEILRAISGKIIFKMHGFLWFVGLGVFL